MSSERNEHSDSRLQSDEVRSRRTVAIHTHGCKLNQADSQSLARQFREAGYVVVNSSSAADIVVLNTCTVTATADSKARQYLRSARRRNPNAVVVATGCYAQRAPTELEGMDAVTLVVGNEAKARLVETAHSALEELAPVPDPSLQVATRRVERTRAMVKIQEGCDQVCAYCIVPRVRGRERSISPELIVDEINRRIGEGYREVALTGTQLGTYGFDVPGLNLLRLLERVLEETGVERLRVSSLQAHEITADLLELWHNPRMMRHFHIPLQSGSDVVLQRMRRRYGTRQFIDAVNLVRSKFPDSGITTDVIVGFPGESSEHFSASRDFAADIRFADIHVFPYSQRPGTSAFHFGDQVPELEKRERMARMLDLAADSHRLFRDSMIGSVRSVLWESSSKSGQWSGLTDNYIRVRTKHASELGNQISDTRLTGLDGEWMVGDAIV